MPDVWSNVADLDAATQERLAEILETRGSDPQQQAMRRAFLADIAFPARAHVLEVGCGTGVLTRTLARWPNVGRVVGLDSVPSLLDKARGLAADLTNVSFQVGDGRSLGFEEEACDAVVFDSTLSHVPDPERALAEAYRVLRPDGWLGVFDGDYATTSVALGDHDPCRHVWMPRWRTPSTTAGWCGACRRSSVAVASRSCAFAATGSWRRPKASTC